jgi:hypothetical protein
MVDDQGAPFLGDGCRFLHGPVDYRFCFVMLEQHPALNLPRLRVDGRKHSFTDQTLADALVTMEGIVDRRETPPSRATSVARVASAASLMSIAPPSRPL